MTSLFRGSLLCLLIVFAFGADSADAHAATATTGASAPCKSAQVARPSATVCARATGVKSSIGDTAKCIISLLGCAINQVTGVDIPGAIGGAIGAGVGDVGKQIVGGIGEQAMDGITGWVAGGVASIVTKVQGLIIKSTTPQVTKAWFEERYGKMLALAGLLSVLALVATVIGGLFKADFGAVMKSAFVYLPIAFFVTGAAVAIVQLSLTASDQMTTAMTASFGADTKTISKGIIDFLTPGAATPAGSLFVMLIFALIAAIGSMMLWIELIVRESAVYLVLLFLPLGCVASIWPPAKRVARKMGILLFVVIASKFFIVAIYAFGATMIAKMGSGGDDTGVLAGVVVMTLAAFSPMVLLKLLPFDEMDAVQGRPNTPVGAQITASQMMRQSLTSRVGGGNGGGSSAGSTGGGPAGSPGTGGGGGPGPGGGGGAGAGKGAGAGGSSGAASGGASGGAAGGAGAAAAPIAGAMAAGKIASTGLTTANNLGASSLGGVAASAGSGSGAKSPGGAPAGSGGGAAKPTSTEAAPKPPPHIAARQGTMRPEVRSV